MSERNLQVLTSRGFLAGLALLLLNDFLLKPLFHNDLGCVDEPDAAGEDF
ncbi:MAG TPA: hypothetical protein VK422_16240 [Pyrinomonadaceae bacterium]|nr:hypothetical protein [Pyrinomonadaceae bacterium]